MDLQNSGRQIFLYPADRRLHKSSLKHMLAQEKRLEDISEVPQWNGPAPPPYSLAHQQQAPPASTELPSPSGGP